MVRFIKQFLSSEKGQALPIVLGVLALGGLTIAGNLNYATTTLKGSQILRENIEGVYAAGAGIEDTLWSLANGVSPSTQLSENINQMAVDIQTLETVTYTLYLGELVEPGNQHWKVSVDGTISWVEGNQYQYEITVTQTAESGQTIHLEEVGARIPVGYHYVAGSTTRSDVVSPPPAHDPVDPPSQDGQGADLLQWLWQVWGARPALSGIGDTFVQTFYIEGIEGGGSPEDHYAWVIGDPTAIGVVGEITGTRYVITATATWPESGETTARIEADVTIGVGITNILSWVILN